MTSRKTEYNDWRGIKKKIRHNSFILFSIVAVDVTFNFTLVTFFSLFLLLVFFFCILGWIWYILAILKSDFCTTIKKQEVIHHSVCVCACDLMANLQEICESSRRS
jgi:hypothetical protein